MGTLFLMSFTNENELLSNEYRVLKDFEGNVFYLHKGNNSYQISDENMVFLEGSNETNSTYYNVQSNNLYCLGFGNYYYMVENKISNILSKEELLVSNFDDKKIKLNYENLVQNKSANTLKSSISTGGFKKISNARYFENLMYFPENYIGECGVVGLTMLLGYLDTFYSPKFIPDNKTYIAREYDKDDNEYLLLQKI